MQSFTTSAQLLRDRVVASKLSFKRIATEADVADRTVSYFVKTGSGRPETLDRIKVAIDRLAPAVGNDAQN